MYTFFRHPLCLLSYEKSRCIARKSCRDSEEVTTVEIFGADPEESGAEPGKVTAEPEQVGSDPEKGNVSAEPENLGQVGKIGEEQGKVSTNTSSVEPGKVFTDSEKVGEVAVGKVLDELEEVDDKPEKSNRRVG